MDPANHSPFSPAGRNPPPTDDERVDQRGWGSFLASDPSPLASDPSPWTLGRERRAHAHQDDPDGGDNYERARRRRHID